jgi:pimeloyl-ACP methyl ester carboxylesterase
MKPSFPKNPRPAGARRKSIADLQKERQQNRPPVTHGYVKSFDDTKLFYSIEGKGIPLVFCYGLVCSSLHWTYQIDYFQNNYKTIWFDYRGHHNSEIPKDLKSLTLENMAMDLGILLDELDIKEAVFLGHSMGVNTVLELYRQQPHRVRGMVLANGTAKPPLETLFRSNALQSAFKLLNAAYRKSPETVSLFWKLQKGNPIARNLVTFGGFNPHLTPKEDIQLYVDQVADMDPGILINLISNYDTYDASAWLHTIKVPTLILAGENDNVIPMEQQELMKQLIPDSRMVRIPHGSHCPQMDLPELFNLHIEKFLTEIGYTSKPVAPTESAAPAEETQQNLSPNSAL